ncbi:MAG: hypothetical protein EHM93_03640 [Bacteroidales bacterium]|nr:MAG: hypothetical protein EHM93_03640 [Bacteroidales bacterium]
MSNDELMKIWENNKQDSSNINQKDTKEMIENYLKPKLSNVYLSFNVSIFVTIASFIASIIVLAINTYVYRENPKMFKIELGLLSLSLLFLFYGVYIFIKLREINNFSRSLVELVHSKLKFLRNQYEVWLVVLSVGMLVLIFGINTLVDNQNGTYRINDMFSYVMVNLFLFAFVYAINKYSAYLNIQKMKLYLKDLQSESMEQSMKDEGIIKKGTVILFFVAVVLTTFLILGILKINGNI